MPSRFRRSIPALLVLLTLAGAILLTTPSVTPPNEERGEYEEKVPNTWFIDQRAWPHGDIRMASVAAAREQSLALRSNAAAGGAAWQLEGPTNVGGRIADVAAHPTNPAICYAGAAEGGVWKTTDGGISWNPTFDTESSLSIGDIAIDPNDPETLYVGTGEPNGGGGSVTYGGTGVFKTTNGGATWTNVGLPESRHIGRVVVDPSNSQNVFVAVLGTLFSTNPERGVYRSTNAGATWSHVLAANDSTGAVDVVVHPTDSNIVYAATWERIRRPNYRNYGGDASGVFRSTDGGDTWSELTVGLPTGSDVGRIGLAISESQPDILYAIFADADPGFFMGVYKTTNGGDTWTQTNDGALSGVYSSFGWWFGNIRVDPTNPDRVFVLGLNFYRSTNGGSSWSNVGSSMHVDHHGLDFAANPSILYEGNDGGMYVSTNGGTQWTKLNDLPVTQFYAIEVDPIQPQRLYGGTQDNSTIRTLTGALDDWNVILGGDGFYVQIDYTDNDFMYAEFQNGNLFRSTNGGSSFQSAQNGLFGRRNWNMPVMIDPNTPTVLYTGTDRVFRSTNRAVSWSAISNDLTNGPHPGNITFGTLTTVAVAETDPDVIWAGSDDGNVWVTQNGGSNWTQVDATLPERWVTRVAIDPNDATIGYCTVSGFRWDEPLPHVFRTTNFGATWTDISGNLPEAPVNDIVIDPENGARLYVGTDFGVYATVNTGESWVALGTDLPNVVVNDLELHQPSRTLYAGTYGRSMWSFHLGSTTGIDAAVAAAPSTPRFQPVAPNPLVAGPATLTFDVPEAATFTLDVYDAVGRRVRSLATQRFDAGQHTLEWDGRTDGGTRVANGVYFVQLTGGGVKLSRKVQVVR